MPLQKTLPIVLASLAILAGATPAPAQYRGPPLIVQTPPPPPQPLTGPTLSPLTGPSLSDVHSAPVPAPTPVPAAPAPAAPARR